MTLVPYPLMLSLSKHEAAPAMVRNDDETDMTTTAR